MELKKEALELKGRLYNSVELWSDDLIDSFIQSHPKLSGIKRYLQNFVRNILHNSEEQINQYVDTAMMFLVDETGEYNREHLFDDLYGLFKSIPDTSFQKGLFSGTIENGTILIKIPDNPITPFLMGGDNAIRIGEKDFMKLKEFFIE